MNFVQHYKQGQQGFNKGLPTGIPSLDMAINGLQKETSIGLCAAPKAGKTTLADFMALLSPYLYMEAHGLLDDIEWIYFSFEISRISKEFKVAAFFFYYDYDITTFSYKGKVYPITQDYLMGKLLYIKEPAKDGKPPVMDVVPVTPDHETKLKEIYRKRIIPIFGEFDSNGKQI